MRLLLDAVGIRTTGGAVVLRSILAELLEMDSLSLSVAVLEPPGIDSDMQLFVRDLANNPRVRLLLIPDGLGQRLAWLQYRVPRLQGAGIVDAVLCLTGQVPWWGNGRRVCYVQQALAFEAYMPKGIFGWKVRLLRVLIRLSARRADMVVAQTRRMQALIEAHVNTGRVWLVRPSPRELVSDLGEHLRSTCVRDRHGYEIGYVGSQHDYKGFSSVVEAMRTANSQQWNLHATVGRLGHGVKGKAWGHVSRQEMAFFYDGLDVLVMPSRAETLGLPLIEAMFFGIPVVAADMPYAREVCGDAALYFSPGDAASLVSQLAATLADETWSERSRRSRARYDCLVSRWDAKKDWLSVFQELARLG